MEAVLKARSEGLDLAIVWNKSNREHLIIGSEPASTREAGEAAARKAGITRGYYFDADHINLKTVDRFIPHCDFFTLDVADDLGSPASGEEARLFLDAARPYIGKPIHIPGMEGPIFIDEERAQHAADTFLAAVKKAGAIYRHIEAAKGRQGFIAEISMDEVDEPQGPEDILLILLAVAQEGIPIQTFAPRFSGRFNKGVEYVGDVELFRKEFEADMLVLAWASKEFGLPENLKLSVHSGSDKFAIYPVIRELISKHSLGIHVKTAGTSWLEEIIGLAEAGGSGLELAREVYRRCYTRTDELTGPYASVIDIKAENLLKPEDVDKLSGPEFARLLRHDQSEGSYNPDMRQLMHVGYKVAAELGDKYLGALDEHEPTIAKQVFENLWTRHIKRIFL